MRDLEIVLRVANHDCGLAEQVRHDVTGPRDQNHDRIFACASDRMERDTGRGTASWNGCLSKYAVERVIGAVSRGATHPVEDRKRSTHGTVYRADVEVGIVTRRDLRGRSSHIHLGRRRDGG